MIKLLISRKPQSPEAVQWVQNLAAHCNATYLEGKWEVYVEQFGDAGTIYNVSEFSDLATYQAAAARLPADAKYQAMMDDSRQRGLFVPGSMHITVLRKV